MTSCTNMENTLQAINAKYVTLKTDEVAYNNELLKTTFETVIDIMKDIDSLFKALYEKPFFGGGYYDDLKVGKPNEFDIHLLFRAPQLCRISGTRGCKCVKVVPSNKSGFFWFTVKENHYAPINQFIKDGYMQTNLVVNWLKGLVTRTLALISSSENSTIKDFSIGTPTYSESGPAITLKLYGEFGNIDVDLVPSFTCSSKHWPDKPYRSNQSSKWTEFFIVPKKPKEVQYSERYWRASFQEQERELIEGRQRLKPALRLLKKMRNNLVHLSVFSYALKTIVLWEVQEAGSINWNGPLSHVFMKLLEKYQNALEIKKIPYFWNESLNLLDGINPETLKNHSNELLNKMTKLKNTNDPFEIAKLILKEGTEEYILFIEEYRPQNTLQYHGDTGEDLNEAGNRNTE